ncbi:tail fiber protein [Enterococcus phage vB_OCPT_CCS1]|uniref:Tail fiber protein n=1 Tax=Enterococcus phage vB_OCPT_CCS1 TaxID=2922323 RepID=A0A9E7J1Y8_9CAUD|nr:tail fiber protein [Enterococcus phage vB_OCPT_CCS1]
MCAIILSRDTYKRKDGINLAGGRRFQAGLGSEHKRLYKEGQQINTLLLAQVIQVNYKYNTVDLLALQHKEVFQNSYANEGRFSARLPMEFGGRNLAGQPYGQVNPIAVGTVVLVGFINSDKDMPIVISVYNNNDVNKQLSRTRFANAEPTDMALAGQMYQKFSLYPSLTYDSIDGDGNRIVTFSGKSFIAFDTKDMQNSPMTDASYGSRYEDLGTSYYNDGELIEPMKGRAPNVLFKHQGILDDDNKPDTHNFMIHINPDGTYRTSMMDTEQDWRTMFEMTPEGKIRLRRQGDTVRLNDGFEIGELGINEEGIVYLRNGDMDLEVREDGIYSQGKLITESINLDDIYEKLANVTFEINKTNESLQILAGKSEVQDGKIVNLETEITIVAGKVESKVSATEVQDMIDSSIVDMAEAIKQAQEDADRANQIISDMASDNRLTPSEKLDLLKEWDIVKNEYPTYLAQAELYEVDSTTYTAKYKALETFVTPLLEDMEATSVVDGSIMRKTFSAYYTERINLLNAITKGLKDGLEEAMKKASQASVDATQALADSAQAQIDANNAKQLIADIASDGKLTASEKYQLKKEWDVIVKEYPTTIAQATKYKVNTDNYTAKYKALETFVTPLFANMNETSVVNGEQLRAVFSDYYAVKITLLKEITDIARDELTDYGNRITVAETKITQTSEAITLMASRVETVENDVRTNTAQLKVQADLISQKVTASEVKDAIDNAIDNMSIGGSNLFVINTQTAGLLNENNGTVGTAVDKSVVSNYIKVTARMPYVASLYGNTGTNSIIIAWYDTSKTFISGQAVADSGDFHKTYVAPENAVYARLSYKKSDTVKMKFEVGTKPTDYSPAWDDIKGDQTALEEYIKQVEEQAKQAQQEAENAKNEAENANSAIADMSNDNMLTANEKQQILLQWEEIKTEYPINLDQATKFGVSATQYTTAYNALKTYLDPLLADMTTTSVIIGSTMRSTFNTYYDRRTTLLNRVAELAKQVADQAKDTADKVDDDLNNIGGYNYIGFSSGDHMYPRLMIKNVGYYYIPSTTSAEFVSDMVCLKPKTATVTSVQYDVGNANASVADVGLANYRMKEVKTGQWLTASANLKVVGTGTAYLTIFTLENGSWKASYSDRVNASQGVTRVVAQRQVTDATTGILVRVDGSSITEVHFGNMQLEVGIRSTPWKKSDIDIQEDINNVADDIKDYIGARSDNLITNGFGELGNNTNIGGIFDGADRIVGKGSFRQEEANKSLLFSEHIVIDNKKVYNFDYYMHTLKGVGRSFAMICPYDVDGVRITYPSLGGRNYNSTTPVEFTKLTKPLKVGDTEVFVEDVSLWNGQAPQDYQRSIIMWGYKNSFGYTYPDGTYSQLMQMRTYDIGAVDTTANKITLNKPWAVANPNSSDGIFPVGHTLSPTSDGSTYLYLNGHVNIQVPTTYTKYSHLISGSSEFANTTIIPVETGSIQLGFLLNRDTTGEKSWLNGLRLRDYTDTYKLNDDVRETQENVDKAQADANKANQSIADLSNDNLVTPNEKLDLKKEWEIIVAEKPKNDAQADKFGVSKVAYGTAYTALSNYITPILASTTTNSAIVGQTMRDTFKAYYTARTDLLNAVATKAKDLADTAQSGVEQVKAKAEKAQADATKAQQDASKAQQDATKANQAITDLSNDNLVTPNEKLDLKKEWEIIVAEKPINDTQADKFGVSKTDYGTKYTALSNYITPILTDLTTNSAIVGQTMRDTFRAYYTARTNLLNSISVKAKELADKAQTDANNAQNSANNAQSSANQAQTDATNAQNSANKAQADATKANQSIADLSNDNLVTPNEKLDLKKEWEIIVAEKPKNDAQADKFGVSKTTYGTAYNALNTYLTPILANLTTNSAIVGQTMRDTFKTYYSARTDLLNAIASKAKDLADNAQDTADNIAVGTRNLLIGTQDFSKGKYPGNTHITITDEKLFGNAVMKNDFTTGTGYSDMYQLTTSIIPTGTQYTLSFYAKADIDKTKMSCYFYNPNTTVNSVNNQGGRITSSDGRSVFVLSTEWTKYWVTWTQTQADRPKSVIIGRKTGGEEPNSAFYMSSPMLVEGNKPQTWMKAPEDIETAINGKEGAWVYSPTAPTNPAIGLVWVDSSKTPNQPKRWVGGETGWVALTPEEVKDLPWGEDGSNLADWVAQAEQKISSDAIINTVLGSEDFTGIFDKKANTEDLNNLASYDDLDAMQAEYERLLKEGIAGIDFSPYVTNTELEQLKDSFTFSVQQAGGVNMLKNSLGFSGLDFWDDDSGRNFYRKNNSVTVTNPNVKFERTADTPNGFKLTGAQDRSGTVRINNVINSNGYWTVSFWLRGSQSGTSNFQMDICDLGVTNFAVTADNDWRKVSLTVNVTNYSQSTYHFVDFQNIAWAYFFIKDFKVEKGITATDWTPAPEDAIVFDPIVTTTQNDQLAKLGFGSGFMVNRAQNAILRQTIELPEAKQGLQYALSFYMNVATFGDTTGLQCGARIYEEGVLKYTVGVTDATQGIPSDYHLYKLVFEPESPNTVIELFVINGAQATVIISGVMYNIGNIALKWQPYPSEIYNTNVKIDINGITVKNNQTDGYTMITPQEFSGYARVNGEMERIFTLNGQVTEVKMLKAEKRITMEPISVFAMNSKETNTIGWAFVASGDVSHTTVSNT